ncbi:MAG TPA: nitrite/sulfite reductase [Anaeromyxobacteraceae bacterium]|nr:nitrite/sulfite reductase [Anaeromyxobacteraceae bacterium]
MPVVEIADAVRSRPSFADPADLAAFVEQLGRYERGEITAEQWRSFRLVHGTYGQRQEGDVHMLRVKVPEGVLAAGQLEALADVTERFGRGFGHVTTRQNLQVHFVKLGDAAPALRRLAEAGITTREACGNSVRNVTACPFAGVSPDEVFDVTPYAEALTRHFLRHPLSSSLPRKFKIAFEGCPEDHAETAIHDLAFRARRREGRRGFAVHAGGGTATLPVSAPPLVEFLPAGDLLAAAEAVVRVFHRLGDRQHRERNRMKFLVRQIGWEAFRTLVLGEMQGILAAGAPPLPFDPERAPVEAAPAGERPPPPAPDAVAALVLRQSPRGPGVVPTLARQPASAEAFLGWAGTNVRRQRQPGFATAAVTLPLGDVTADQLRVLAALSRSYGDGAARFTSEQDLLLRWVREEDLPALHARLAAAGLAREGAGTVLDVVSCPGAETCRLAVTQSRGLGRLLEDHLRSTPRALELAPDLSVRVSGCPNGCSRHHVAGIGFQGSLRKVGDRAVPQYFVLVGGSASGEAARFGRLAAKIPARRIPEAVDRLLDLYQRAREPGERATDFFGRVDLEAVRQALRGLGDLDAAAARPEDFVDLGEERDFHASTLEGECAA